MIASRHVLRIFPLLAAAALASCEHGTTGGDTFLFEAAAGGVDRDPTQPFVFDEVDDKGQAWHVQLTSAHLTIGPVYLNDSLPISQSQNTSCYQQGGRYIGQVLSILDIDTLSPALTFFPTAGQGVSDTAVTGDVWLYGPAANSDGSAPILSVAGMATSALGQFPFAGQLALTSDWLPPANPSMPGANPLCLIREVTGIPVSITPVYGGGLVVRVDPTHWFDSFDFSVLQTQQIDADGGAGDGSAGDGGSPQVLYVLGASPGEDTSTRVLVQNLRARTGIYSFAWVGPQ